MSVVAADLGAPLVLVLAGLANFLVLAYRSPRLPSVRATIDRWRTAATGQRDWNWLRLEHLVLAAALVGAANVAWQLAQVHCSDDAYALYASGRAALGRGDPFSVSFCGHSGYPIPYGLAAVALNALGALAPPTVGIWVVWQALALTIVPLVWYVSGDDRRYRTVLAASSVLFLPNIATNIGVDNAIVPIAVLVGLLAGGIAPRRRPWAQALAAFLATARFPALLPLLGVAGARPGDRLRGVAVTAGVFFAGVAVCFALWGPDAYRVPYLGQFARNSGGTLNAFALLTQQGWFRPSLESAAVQGGVLLALVGFVAVRGYTDRAAAALPLLGVMTLSQYLSDHFTFWLLPLVLLGPRINAGLLAYGAAAAIDYGVCERYLGATLGLWGPYELLGVLLSVLLVVLLIEIVRDEERRLRRTPARPARDPD